MTFEDQAQQIPPDDIAKVLRENAELQAQVASIKSQLDWFKRQLFGRKSEKLTELDTSIHATERKRPKAHQMIVA